MTTRSDSRARGHPQVLRGALNQIQGHVHARVAHPVEAFNPEQAHERIAEAIRATSLPDLDFEDYVQGWIPIKITAHDESESLRKRSEAWFRNYIATGTISEDELLNIPDPAEKPVQPFIRET